MKQSEWTRKAVDALEQAGLVQTGFVNIAGTTDGGYRMELADPDNAIFEVTVRTVADGN